MDWNVFDPNCPTRVLLDRIGDKWTVLVVCALASGPLHFGELKRVIGGAAPKVLTSVLRSLERDGIVNRHVFTGSPVRVEYSLSDLGESLVGAVNQLRHWAENHMIDVSRAQTQYAESLAAQAEADLKSPVRRVSSMRRLARPA